MPRVRCVGSDPKRAMGVAPLLVVCDEISTWPATTTPAMLSTLRTSLVKLEGARILSISTRSAIPEHPFEQMLREAGTTYSADPEDNPFAVKTMKKSNPSWAFMPTLRKQVKRYAKRAKKSPSVMASYRALHLNLGVLDVDRPHLIDPESWLQVEVKTKTPAARRPAHAFGDSTLAPLPQCPQLPPSIREPDGSKFMAAFPNEPSLADRGLQDSVGDLYRAYGRRRAPGSIGGEDDPRRGPS